MIDLPSLLHKLQQTSAGQAAQTFMQGGIERYQAARSDMETRYGIPSAPESLMMQSALMQAPPYSPPIGYEEMSPFERAAYRVRGAPGAQPPEKATPGEMAQAAMMLVPGAAITAAPRLAIPALAGGALLYSTDQAGSQENPEAVKALQIKLREQGFYTGAIDGRMGPATARAQQNFMAAEELKVRQQAANAATAETRRRLEEDRRRAQQREEGEARLRETEQNVPWYRRALRDYATPIGVAGGMLAGAAARSGVTSVFNKLSERAARRAEGLFETTARGPAARVARVNEFWRRGGGEVPFTSTPNTAPGFAANPNASPLEQLYQASRARNIATDVGITGAFAGESALGQSVLLPQAREELRAAQDLVSKDPSEVNIGRMQAALDRVAVAEALTNFGRAGALSYPGAALKMQRRPTAPAMNRAEEERLQLEQLLRSRSKPKAVKSPSTRSSSSAGQDTTNVYRDTEKGTWRYSDEFEGPYRFRGEP
jgi:hypothetical protein